MAVVFVNGNPENGSIWDPLLARLALPDARRLSPPGFGAPIPEDFPGTVDALRDWLIEELERIGEPVDLVGHDVGGSTVLAVAMARPDLLRSWVSDSLGVFDPDYEWHPLAREWQTPELGEESVARWMGGTIAERTERVMERVGADRSVATSIAGAQGPEMGRAILAFYRSAIQPVMSELGRNLEAAAARPGLAVIGTSDTFVGSESMRRRAARRAGAREEILPGIGHWWMVQDSARVAEVLTGFWAESSRPSGPATP
nr:alpha/beta fold hydrolase [Sciscionella marina]